MNTLLELSKEGKDADAVAFTKKNWTAKKK